MINRLFESGTSVEVQETSFSIDVLGRYICNTWDEAVNNGARPFDAVVIGGGMFGAYCAEKIYRKSNMRVLVLDAGSLLVTEHVQNLARIGLNAAGPKKDPSGRSTSRSFPTRTTRAPGSACGASPCGAWCPSPASLTASA